MATHPSPIRYPGGKTLLAPYLAEVMKLNDLEGGIYVEPFAGGAGAALKLLFSEMVSHIYINDLDLRIYSFWQAILNHTEEFVRLIQTTSVTVCEWMRQKRVLKTPLRHTPLEIGFATFFLNRTNRSGVLNAGPIGGHSQTGNYKIDARFNKKELIRKINTISLYRDRITVKNLDAVKFMETLFHSGEVSSRNALIYMDPPYFEKAESLYDIYFRHPDHEELATFLSAHREFRWIVSYDDNGDARRLYRERLRVFIMKYSAHTARVRRELIIASPNCVIPARSRVPSLSTRVSQAQSWNGKKAA